MRTTSSRIVGFDYGKALAVLFVLLWHEHIFGRGPMFSIETSSPALPSMSDFLYANVLLQAVPFFIFLSCYLYAVGNHSWEYLKRRAVKLVVLHVFWGVTYFLVVGGVPNLLNAIALFQERPIYAAVTAMGSYYFFFALLVTTALTHVAIKLSTRALFFLLASSAVLVVGMQFAMIDHLVDWAAAFWSPLNYIAVAPAVVLLSRYLNGRRPGGMLIAAAVILFIVVAAVEWAYVANPVFTATQGYAVPAYTRLSPLLFSCAAICTLLRFDFKSHPVVSFAAKYSLAVYCLQAFVIEWTSGTQVPVVAKVVIDLILTYALAYGLHRFIFKADLLASEAPR